MGWGTHGGAMGERRWVYLATFGLGEGLSAPRRPPRVASHAHTHGSQAQEIKRRSSRRYQGRYPLLLSPCLAHPFSPLSSAPPAPSLALPLHRTLGLSLPAPLLLWLVLPLAHHWA